MIRRDARPHVAAAPTITPHDGRNALPSFSPTTPADGWTPATVWETALTYADDIGDTIALSRRRLTLVAERALYASLPSSVKKSQAIERLRGVDRIGDILGTRATANGAAPDGNDASPF